MRVVLVCLLLSSSALAKNENWPNGPNEDPRLQFPDDGGYVKLNDKGEVTGGQWNLWSFVPEKWAQNSGFNKDEIPLGTGIHADRAWQRTIGDRRTIIAVLDSGIKWEEGDLQMKFYLNKAELGNCKPTQPSPPAADEFDIDGNGYFNIADYLVVDPEYGKAKDEAGNKNGTFDPGDLIKTCSDGKDDDDNGYTDDISGWDTFRNDNDPYDDTRYGHGTGEARDSAAAGNDGKGDIGVCPECSVLMVRTGDSFVVDSNDWASSVLFAVDSGTSVIQEALGSVNMTPFARAAAEYAYRNNVVIIASAADELSFHHNLPGTNNHMVYVHAVVHDADKDSQSTTFLNFNNCTNFGGQLLLSTPGGGCSSEATGISSGHAGLIYSAGFKASLEPPLTAEELRGILIMSADDIIVKGSELDSTKFPSGPGWDMHFGYGRNNARKSVDMVLDGEIPPEADITEPYWFEPVDVVARPKIDITGRVGARVDGKANRYDNYAWELEWAKGVDPKGGWSSIAKGDGARGDLTPAVIGTFDAGAAAAAFDYTAPLTDPHQYSATLRLRVTTKKGDKSLANEFRKTIHLIKDETLLPGFPKHMHASLEPSPKIVDLDGDAKEDIVYAGTDGYIHALKFDGTEVAGFPAALGARPEADPSGPNVLNRCAFRAEDKKGPCKAKGFVDPALDKQAVMYGIAIGALTGDDKDLSLVTTTYDGYVFAFDAKGKARPGWPQRVDPARSIHSTEESILDDGFFAAPVLYDMDGDKKLEIIGAAMDGYVYVWHHDGTPMVGWPVLVHDPLETQLARIIDTPAVGDVDGDGSPEIAVGTNEAYGAGGVENESRGYLLKATGSPNPEDVKPALMPGWPVTTTGITVNTLPVVGRGTPTNPAMADLDGDGKLEIHLDAIGLSPNLWAADGSPWGPGMDNSGAAFGLHSTSVDGPAFTLINNGSFAKVDPGDTIDLIKGTAGFDFALTFVQGGKRAQFDHQISAWDTATGNQLDGFPRVVDDWQFFMNPTVADIDGDNLPEIISGSGGYLLHAWNYRGDEPKGFPKMTGGWIISSPAFGDIDGDGTFEVVSMTRSGWLFVWKTTGATSNRIEWQTLSHDFHNTGNYNHPVAQYNHYPKSSEPPPPPPPENAETTPVAPPVAAESSDCAAGQPRGGMSWGWLALLAAGFAALRLRRRRA